MQGGTIQSSELEGLLVQFGRKRRTGTLHVNYVVDDEEHKGEFYFYSGKISNIPTAAYYYCNIPEGALLEYSFEIDAGLPSLEAQSVSQFLLDLQSSRAESPSSVDEKQIHAEAREKKEQSRKSEESHASFEAPSLDSKFLDGDDKNLSSVSERTARYFLFVFILGSFLIPLLAWQEIFRAFAD
jgi:hypothetical protein